MEFVGQLSTTCSYATAVAQWELLVAVDRIQLRTMASEKGRPNWLAVTPTIKGQYLIHAT